MSPAPSPSRSPEPELPEPSSPIDVSDPAPAARRFVGALALVWCGLGISGLAGVESPYFRPWERVARSDAWTFEPDQRVSMEGIGDLGALNAVRELQVRREVVFSTDARGLRNPSQLAKPARVVVVGDSYVAGCGLSDAEIVTERLSERLGEPVCNYGLETGYAPLLLLQDEVFQRAPPRLVIFAPVARRILPLPSRAPERPKLPAASAAWRGPGVWLAKQCADWQRDNGLTRGARAAQQGLRYRLFGLPGLIQPEGEPALALSLEDQGLCVPASARDPERVVASLVRLQREWAQRGTQFVFCPLPESGTIYPELFPAESRAQIATPSFLDELLARSRAAGLPCVDLRPVLRAEASPYLYRRDDSHWGPRAVELTAQAWAESPHVREALAPR